MTTRNATKAPSGLGPIWVNDGTSQRAEWTETPIVRVTPCYVFVQVKWHSGTYEARLSRAKVEAGEFLYASGRRFYTAQQRDEEIVRIEDCARRSEEHEAMIREAEARNARYRKILGLGRKRSWSEADALAGAKRARKRGVSPELVLEAATWASELGAQSDASAAHRPPVRRDEQAPAGALLAPMSFETAEEERARKARVIAACMPEPGGIVH